MFICQKNKHKNLESKLFFLCRGLFALALSEQVSPSVEILLELDADALCGERGLNEVAVVGLVVRL